MAQNIKQNEGKFIILQDVLHTKCIINIYEPTIIKETRYNQKYPETVLLLLLSLFRSDQIRSVDQSCPTLCDPMNRSTPGLPVHHQLPEFSES